MNADIVSYKSTKLECVVRFGDCQYQICILHFMYFKDFYHFMYRPKSFLRAMAGLFRARAFGDGEYVFRVIDDRDRGRDKHFQDKNAFLAYLAELTNGGSISKYSVYESSLGGKFMTGLMHLKMPDGKKIRHEYVTMEVEAAKNERCFVSLEKGQSGILAQLSLDEARVCQWRPNRDEALERRPSAKRLSRVITRVDMTDIKHSTKFSSAPAISDFLDLRKGDGKNDADAEGTFDIVPNYHLFSGNCQLFVIDFKTKIDLIAKSKEIKFSLPGSGGQGVTIDDPTVPGHLEKLYPRLAQGQLVKIPECAEKFLLVDDNARPRLGEESLEANEYVKLLR